MTSSNIALASSTSGVARLIQRCAPSALATVAARSVARDRDRCADFTVANFGHKCQVGVGRGKRGIGP